MAGGTKPLVWIGSSKKDLLGLPRDVRRFFGHALHSAQQGERHIAAKALKGFGNAGVLEIVESGAGGTYRAVYTVSFDRAVFVLHCFRKKSRTGIATPHEDIAIIRVRMKVAERLAKEPRNDETQNHGN